jgi:hypothetical protein
MARLMTLAQAKGHLRVFDDDHNGEIDLKIVQASAAILNYLKGRANTSATILSASVANPTVITTATTHYFVTGDTVVITGDTTATPALNGSYPVTVVTSSTFTIPLAVTVASSGASAVVEWTELTVPGPVQAAALLMLTHLFENRGDDQKTDEDLWKAVERLTIRYRDMALA